MRERVELLVGRATRAMWVMTFHSACARMLRADAHRLGYTRQFTIYDGADSRRLIKKCLDDLDVDPKRFTPRAMQAQISDAKNKPALGGGLPPGGRLLLRADGRRRLRALPARAPPHERDGLRRPPVPGRRPARSSSRRSATATPRAFRWVLVDEYQDTNHAQYRWLQLLASEHRNLAVVGDDDQCLVEGTPVTMGDGSIKPIEDVQVGDEVLSCYGSGDFRPARVTGRHVATGAARHPHPTAGGRSSSAPPSTPTSPASGLATPRSAPDLPDVAR